MNHDPKLIWSEEEEDKITLEDMLFIAVIIIIDTVLMVVFSECLRSMPV